MSLPRRQAASSRSTPYPLASRRMPRQARNPCSGCGFARMIASNKASVAGPIFSASRIRRVLWDRGVPVPHGRERMAGNARAAIEDLDGRVGDARLDDFTDEARGDGVEVACNLDVVIGGDTGAL